MASVKPFRFDVVVQPGARQTRVCGRHGDALKLQIQARPVDGAANRAVVELLAAAFGVPRGAVQVVAGGASRRKVVAVDAADAVECRRRLESLLAADGDEARR